MALTIALDDVQICPAIKTGTIAFDSAYVVGGEPLTLSALNLRAIRAMLFQNSGAYRFEYDVANKKIIARSGGGFEGFGYSDIKGSANTESPNTDQAALPTNGALISAVLIQTDVRTASGVLIIAASPDVPRNVCICIQNASGGALNLYEGTTSFVVVGTYLGAPQTETISITSTAGNKAVADTKFRYTYGSKPFSTITSITEGAGAADMAGNLKIGAGLGSKLGLPGAIAATGDVITLSKNAAYLSPSGIVSATNMTVNFGTLTDGDDTAGIFASSGEVPTGMDLSGVTGVRFVAIGKPA